MNILPGILIYISIVVMKANAVLLLKYITVSYATEARSCIVYARNDKPDTMGEARQNYTAQEDIAHVYTVNVTLPAGTGSVRPSKSQNIDNIVNRVQ